MANLSHIEPVHQYSWWGSHISPSNSKWIQENLKGMEMTVEAMLKLIEEDADSFARRAEMYYKKRPELKNLVDEFYRGYRALAERYEHSTRALHHVHRTMAEAFPSQIPPLLSDEYAISAAEVDSHNPKIILPARSLFDFYGTKKGALRTSPDLHSRRRHDLYTEGSDSSSCKKGLKQYSETFATGQGETGPNSSEGKVKKGVQILEEESKFSEDKALNQDQEVKVKREANNATENLQNDILQLSAEIHALKEQIMEESKRANNAESEIQCLKGTLSKLSSEKDEALLHCQVSLDKISSLETLLSRTQYDLEKTNDDMVSEIRKLKNAEELNQSLQLGLDTLEQKAKMQEHEINQKQEELEKLQTTLQDKYKQFLEIEMALVLSENRYVQSQEKAKLLGLEIQKGIEKLKNVEKCNMGLEAGMRELKEENSSLNEQNLHFTLLIKDLQSEKTLSKENKTKFEDELGLLLNEKEVLSQELYHVKEEKNELEQRYHDLWGKLQAVSKRAETLQAAIEDLINGNCQLKEVCKKHEAEKELLTEKIVVLERFLLDANVDLEILREKVVVLENTHDSLKSKISIYICERDSLASQLEILTENKAALSAQNTLLENSLFDASREVESLRSQVKNLEESCQSFDNQNSGLLAEKYALVSRVECISTNLEDLENTYSEMTVKYLNLSGERDLMINQVKELGDILEIEKQQHETCMQSYENLLATSENRISLLREENQYKDKELETEVHNVIDALMENFILRRSLIDLKERNLVLTMEGRRYLEACRSAETLVSKLEQEKIIQMRNTMVLTKDTEELRKRIRLLCKVLNLEKGFRSMEEIQDEVLLEIILYEMKKVINSYSEVEDNNHQLQLEISVLATLVRHIGIDMINLSLQKYSLERELENKNDKLVAYGNEKHELLARNGRLERDIEAANQREELLKNEIKVLYIKLTHGQKVLQTKQLEITKLIEERKSLSQEICDLRQQFSILEDEHIEVILQAMYLDHLFLLFESINADRAMELMSLGYDLDTLHMIKNNLVSEVDRLKGIMSLLEVEKMYFSNSVTYLEEELRSRLLILEFDLNFVTRSFEEQNFQIETINKDLIEKEAQLSEANQKMQSAEEKIVKSKRLIEAFQLDIVETKMVKEKMEKENSNLSQDICDRNEEIRCLCEKNKMSQRDIDEIHKRAEVLTRREDFLISELQKQTNEIADCEGEIAVMLNDIQFLTVNGALLDEKVHELIVEDELRAMVEKEILVVELSSSRRDIEELQHKLRKLEGKNKGLKTDLDVHLLMLKSLWDGVVSMEGQIMSITKHALVNNHPKEHASPLSQKHWCRNQPTHRGGKTAGVLLLEKLNNKVESLQELIIYHRSLFEQESIATLDSGRKEVEILKTNVLPVIDVSSEQFDVADGKGDAEHCKEKYEEMKKDIQLDQVSSSLPPVDVDLHGPSIETPGVDEHQSSERLERSCNNQACKTSATTSGNSIQSTEHEERYHLSSKRVTEEPSIVKLDVHRKPSETEHDWKQRVLKRLNSGTQRLSDLRNSIEDLKKTTNSQSDKPSMIYGLGSIKEQLEETEGAMLELIETNTRLKNMAEGYASLDGTTIKPEDRGSTGRRQILEQTRLGSENIAKLEFKLQKIRYVLMKIVEEHEERKHKATRKNRVVLSDYLYGKRHSQPRRSSLCDCMTPKAESHC